MQLSARPLPRIAAVALLALALRAAPAQAAAPGAVPTRCTETVDFLGFSRNERTLALRTVADCRHADGAHDQLQLIKLLDVATGRTLATYEESPSWRVARGRRHLLARTALVASYPSLAQLQAPNAWRRVRAAGAFAARRHDFADASVRLRVDESNLSDPDLQLHAKNKSLRVWAHDRAHVKFTVIARLANGEHAELGHFVRPAGLASAASLDVYASKPGHRVGLLWRVNGHTRLVTYSTTIDARFANNDDAGAVNVLSGTAEEVESIYKAMHPKGAKIWDENVGELY